MSKLVGNIIQRYGVIKVSVFVFGTLILGHLALLLFLIIVPLEPDSDVEQRLGGIAIIEIRESSVQRAEELARKMRPGLFRPSTNVSSSTLEDKAVREIVKQVKLHSIMAIEGQAVAYIVLNKKEFRKCKIGETVKGMFKVIDIQPNGVVLDVLGSRVEITR